MRIIFAGTPEAAVPSLMALIESSHDVVGVLTRPPARRGRARKLLPSPVARVAADHDIPLIEVSSMRDESTLAQLRGLNADLGVVVAYGVLLTRDALALTRLGWINLHFSDLPRWRGAAPVQWAILTGDTTTASSIFQLEEGLDTGPVYSRREIEIGHVSAGELLTEMAALGATQIVDTVDDLEAGRAEPVPQSEGPQGSRITLARRLTHEDGFIDFTSSADEIDRRIRAVTPNPGAWSILPDGRRIKLGVVSPATTRSPGVGRILATKKTVEVGCADTTVVLGDVAPAGRGWMDAPAWARGARLDTDAQLGQISTKQEK